MFKGIEIVKVAYSLVVDQPNLGSIVLSSIARGCHFFNSFLGNNFYWAGPGLKTKKKYFTQT